jgi:hypothetical protein
MPAEFSVPGDSEARIDGQPVAQGHARQQRVLVALLADASRPVPAAELTARV